MTFNPDDNTLLQKSGDGRLAVIPQINTYEAKQTALLMIRRGRMRPQTKLYYIIGLLGTSGVLPENIVISLGHLTARTLRNYRKKGILDNVPIPENTRETLNPKKLWTLGPVGIQLAKIQFELIPTGYLESTFDNITHDVLCNQIYYEIHKILKETPYTAILKSRYEVALRDFRQKQILQPDGMIILRHRESGEEKPFLLEYHNEDSSHRAPKKVKKYEYVYSDVEWREQWNLTAFPPILIVSTHRAVASGYKENIEKRGIPVKCRYLIRSLKSFLEKTQDPLIWLDLAKNKTVNILSS